MKVVTYATHSDGAFEYLRHSFERFKGDDDEFVVLGWQQPWKGFGHRILAYQEYAASCSLTDTLLCIDAHDVVLTNSLRDLNATFHNLLQANPSSIFMSTEKQALFHQYYTKHCSFGLVGDVAICAGVFIGEAKDIAHVIQNVCADGSCQTGHFDDQKAFVEYANQQQTKIVLDTEWNMFATIGGYNNFDVEHTFRYSKDGTLKAFDKNVFTLHHPGNTDMQASLYKLGYDTSVMRTRPHYFFVGAVHWFYNFPALYVIILLFVVVVWLTVRCFKCSDALRRCKR